MVGRKFTQPNAGYRYGFNGKEEASEIANDDYDYGARIYDPRVGRWLAVDPLISKYPCLSPYNFVTNTPLQAMDPDGELIIFVNGYWNSGSPTPGEISAMGANWPIIKQFLANNLVGTVGGRNYWGGGGVGYEKAAQNYFNDYTSLSSKNFVDGRGKWNSTGQERFNAGYEYAKSNFEKITAGMTKDETIKIVSHSMGGAYSEGMIKYFEENGKYKVEKVLHLSMADPTEFTMNTKPLTIQLKFDNDVVLGYKNLNETSNTNPGTDISGVANTGGVADSHYLTKADPSIFEYAKDLETMQFTQETYSPWHSNGDYEQGTGNYKVSQNANGSTFKQVTKGNETFIKNSSNNDYHKPHL